MNVSISRALRLFASSVFILGLIPTLAFAQAQQVGTTTALNWAGYVSQGGTYTAVSGSWVVPTVSITTDNQADATWVGIGGVSSHDLIQAGTQALPNSNGGVSYEAWYELLPGSSKSIPLAVHPGDSVSVSITQQSESSGSWLISFNDSTTGASYSTTVQYASSLSSADWIEEMPAGVGEQISLDNFGTVDFSGGSTVENGTTETISGSGAQSLTMANQANQALAIPSAIGSDGASFSVTRTDASSDSIGTGITGIYGYGHRSFTVPAGAIGSTTPVASVPGGITITYYTSSGNGGSYYANTTNSNGSYSGYAGGRGRRSYGSMAGTNAIRIMLLNDFFKL